MITGFSESPCETGDSQGAQYLLNHPVQPLPHPVNHPVPHMDPTNNTYYMYIYNNILETNFGNSAGILAMPCAPLFA